MSVNALEQIIQLNPELTAIGSTSGLGNQTNDTINISSKLDRKKDKINSDSIDAITYIAVKKFERVPATPAPVSSSVVTSEDINNYLESKRVEDDKVTAAATLEYEISRKIDKNFNNLSAKEIYNIKKTPAIINNIVTGAEVVEEIVSKLSNDVDYINNSNSNYNANQNLINSLLN